MFSKVLFLTCVLAICVLIPDVSAQEAQECSLLRRCQDGCCAMFNGQMTGTCSTGDLGEVCNTPPTSGFQLLGTRCGCNEGLKCTGDVCVSESTSTASTTMAPSSEPSVPDSSVSSSAAPEPSVPPTTAPEVSSEPPVTTQ